MHPNRIARRPRPDAWPLARVELTLDRVPVTLTQHRGGLPAGHTVWHVADRAARPLAEASLQPAYRSWIQPATCSMSFTGSGPIGVMLSTVTPLSLYAARRSFT